MKLENTKNTFSIEIADKDLAEYRHIYLMLWKDKAELGPTIHIETTIRLLISQGYKITPK